jgi:hypothetical protein
MGLGKADFRAKLIDPAIHAFGCSEDHIKRKLAVGAIDITDRQSKPRATGERPQARALPRWKTAA